MTRINPTIVPRLLLLAGLAVLAALLASADARAQQACTVDASPSFRATTFDVIADSRFYNFTSGRIQYKCPVTNGDRNVTFCHYIRPSSSSQYSPTDGFTFYQTRDTDSVLAWSMHDTAGGGPLVARENSGFSAPYTYRVPFDSNQQTYSTLMTVKYLARQLQNRVRPGTYTDTYTLVTQYRDDDTRSVQCGTSLPGATGTLTTPFTITTTIPTYCQFENLKNIDFGTVGGVAATSGAASPAKGGFDMRCTYETPYSVTAGDGLNASSGQRRMKNGAEFIPYQLYQADCATPWTNTAPITGKGNVVNMTNRHDVCARVPRQQAPKAGTYTDTVVLTATF